MKLRTLVIAAGLAAFFSFPAMAGWVEIDNGQWTYEQDGSRVSGEWIQDQGKWYYLNTDGIMLAGTTQTIDGTEYSFDGSGRWIEPSAVQTGVNGSVYTNTDFSYTLEIPSGMAYSLEDNGSLNLGSDTTLINIGHLVYTAGDVNVTERAEAFVSNFKGDIETDFAFQYTTEVTMGDRAFTRYHFYSGQYNASVDLYISIQENGFMSVFAGYVQSTEPTIQNILRTMKKLP